MNKMQRVVAVALVLAVSAVIAGPASAHHREGHVGKPSAEPTPEPSVSSEPSPQPEPSPSSEPNPSLADVSECADRMSPIIHDSRESSYGVQVPGTYTYVSPFAPFSAITVALCLIEN